MDRCHLESGVTVDGWAPDDLEPPDEGPPVDHGGTVSPPPVRPGTGGGRGRTPGTPGRGYLQYLPILALGAVFLAVERVAMITLAMAGLPDEVYILAATVLLGIVFGGTLIGGYAFYRAFRADRI